MRRLRDWIAGAHPAGHPDPLLKTLDFVPEYSARIDLSDYDRALGVLRETGAFEEPEAGVRLRLPTAG